jgi:hypothetical protein
MKLLCVGLLGLSGFMVGCAASTGQVTTTVAHNSVDKSTPAFVFNNNVPSPVAVDSVPAAKFTIVDGEQDPAGADISAVHDGKLPTEEDQPEANFFFNAGTEGGRFSADLGSVIEIKQINTYSWHPDTRAPQLYKLYASDGASANFKADPKHDVDPTTVGWKLLASVDTRPKDIDVGGQYGVSITDTKGSLGKFRYLLFDVSRTEADDEFGNTFFSEINIIDTNGVPAPTTAPTTAPATQPVTFVN